MTRSASFAPLRHRAYRLVWAGSLVSNTGTWMQAAALGYYTAHMTQSAGWTALVAAGEFAPTALLGPIGGALADRMSRKLLMIIASFVQAGLATAMTVAMVVGHPHAPVLALYALANGCVFALGFPSFSALLPELVPPEQIGAAVGLSSASWNLGRVVGPLFGTLLYQAAGISWVLGLNAASFLAVVLALLTVHVPHHERARRPLFAAIAEGFRFVVDEPGLRVTMQSLCLVALFIAPFIGLIPVMVEKEFGGGKTAVGWLITGQGVGAVMTGVVFGSLSARFGVRRIMLAALTLCPVALILYAVSPTWWVALLPIVALGSLYFFALSSFTTVANLRAPSELRGRVLSLNQVVLGTVYAISLNVAGQLGDRVGLRQVLIGGAVISLLVLAVVRVTRPGYSRAVDEPVVPADGAAEPAGDAAADEGSVSPSPSL